jgi:predicted small metal-binding protein
MSIAVIYATCTACEFELSAQSLDELDEKFNRHFVISGHEAYFYRDKNIEKIRKIA